MSSSTLPFADPLWFNRGYSPYYKDSHRRLQKEVRSYIDTHIAPYCEEWEKNGSVPADVWNEMCKIMPVLIIYRYTNDTQRSAIPLLHHFPWLQTISRANRSLPELRLMNGMVSMIWFSLMRLRDVAISG